MSRRRQSFPFSKYSLSPDRNSRRVTTISPARNCCWNFLRRIFKTTAEPECVEAVGVWASSPVLGPEEPLAQTGSSSGNATAILMTFERRILTPSVFPGRDSSVICSTSSAARARISVSSQSSAGISSRKSSSVGSFLSGPSYSSGLISVSDTSAMPVGLRSRVPAKITSSMREPRRVFADCSPSTHEMASAIFDFPQPLGPIMAATPSPWNLSYVRSQNELNPRICSLFSLSNVHSFDTLLSSQAESGGPLADRSTQSRNLRFDSCCDEMAPTSTAKSGFDASPHGTGLPSRFLRRFDSSKSVPGWTGRTQIRVTVPIKSRQGQVVKHHMLWVTRLKPIIWQRLCTFCLVSGYGVGKEGKNRESEISLAQAVLESNQERQ